MGPGNLSSLEICAGAGGQALGLEQAGFEPVLLLDNDLDCCTTLVANRPHWDVRAMSLGDLDVNEHPQVRGVDLLAGGVPCTPYSVAGHQAGDLDERDLLQTAIELVGEVLPRAVMIENVAELVSNKKFKQNRANVMKRLDDLGYMSCWEILDAQDFGVPQRRKRSVLVAMRPEDFKRYRSPAPVGPPPTVAEILRDSMASNGWPFVEEWAAMANAVAPTIVGGSKKHGGPDLGPDRAKNMWALLGVNGNSLADALPDANDGFELDLGRKGRYGLRKLTVPQVALLQGFPADWVFTGNKTASYKQVGNAFPPPVARAVGIQVMAALNGVEGGTRAQPSLLDEL